MQEILDELAVQMKARSDCGEPANYIPELAAIDPKQFAVAVSFADGSEYCAGDASVPFSIQSVS